MIDLSTEYLGLALKNPLVPSSSPLTSNFNDIRRLEDAGASAVVLPSLFEEELIAEQEHMGRFLDHQGLGHHEADSFLPLPDDYVSHLDKLLLLIQQSKRALDIPVIGSLNGISQSGWLESAIDLQDAGCDAIELNLYSIASDANVTSMDIEENYLQTVSYLASKVTIPITIKLSSQFTSLSHTALRMQESGAGGLVCFNRFYQPDIDLDTLRITPTLHYSTPIEAHIRIRWIALLRSQLSLSLAATGGFHSYSEVIKGLLAGADAVYLCSVLLNRGIATLGQIVADMTYWMEEKEYSSIKQLKGSLSYNKAASPTDYERANYLEVIDSYTHSKGVKV